VTEVAVSRQMFKDILMFIARLRAPPTPALRSNCVARRPDETEDHAQRTGHQGISV
jgi:hypothetical protein